MTEASTPTCPSCSAPLRWRDPTDTMREHMFVCCDCTDVDFQRPELAIDSAEAGVYKGDRTELKEDGRDLRADIIEYWGEVALAWIEQKSGIRARPT